MADDSVSATTVINAPAEAIFAVLAEPAKHAAIDRTGWVRETLDSKPLTATGQIFRMSMYHPNHPDGNYQMANRSYLPAPGPGHRSRPGCRCHRPLGRSVMIARLRSARYLCAGPLSTP